MRRLDFLLKILAFILCYEKMEAQNLAKTKSKRSSLKWTTLRN